MKSNTVILQYTNLLTARLTISRWIWTCMSMGIVTSIAGQPPQLPTTPSAVVYNYSKYAEVAPNLYTGAVSEQIPLGSVSAGPLSQAVSLSYYFNGHRPSDLSSAVGLGWTLNAGGVITRQVLALDDFDEYGWLETGDQVQGTIVFGATLYGAYRLGHLDPQADVYSLQVGGLNVKFAMDYMGHCHTIPRSDLEIEYITDNASVAGTTVEFNYFLLTDTEGRRYYFGQEQVPNSTAILHHTEETTFAGEEGLRDRQVEHRGAEWYRR